MRKVGKIVLVFSFVVFLVISDRPQRTQSKAIVDRHTPLREIGTVVNFLPFSMKKHGPYTIKLVEGPKAVDLPLSIFQAKRARTTEIKTEAPKVLAPTPVTAAHSASGDIQTVINYAMAQLGDPYVWGAAGPNTFDCSGLVMRAYAQIGLSLPHFTGALISRGRAVSRADLAIGDIVFPNKGHVGIYVGDNKIIHAPKTGDVVKISTIWNFYTARRLI